MAVQCVLAGKGKDDVFTAIYGETTFDKVSKAYNEKKVVQVIYQNRIYYLDNTTSGTVFSFISTFSNKNGEIEHYVISLSAEGNWSGPSLQNSTPATHANTHAKDGTDPLAPADIGAMEMKYDANLPDIPSSPVSNLNNYTWEQINSIALSGKAKQYFALGATKSVTLTNSVLGTTTHNVMIIGINQDNDNSITFQTQNCFANNIIFGSNAQWIGSYARSFCQKYYNSFSDKKYILAVSKGTCSNYDNNRNASVTYNDETVWLPSEREMGLDNYSPISTANSTTSSAECTKGKNFSYEYYDDNSKRIKKDGDSSAIGRYYWSRSRHYSSAVRTYMCVIGDSGFLATNDCGNGRYLAPAFIIGNNKTKIYQSDEDITSQVAQALSGDLVPFSGGIMTGLLNVLTPVGDSNATTKKYVDDALSEKIGMDGIGDLHVWKKTVVNSQAVAAYFSLGPTIAPSSPIIYLGQDDTDKAYIMYSPSALGVRDNGNIYNDDPTYKGYWYGYHYNGYFRQKYNTSNNQFVTNALIGSYVYFHAISSQYNANSGIELDTWYYIPNDATVTVTNSAQTSLDRGVQISKLQKVIGHPYTPAGTTTTYPVSTNRNAYQEGSDAKPAGYTLGDVVSGNFKMSERYPTDGYYYKYASSISVADNGTVSLDNPAQISFDRYNGGQSCADNRFAEIAGKFIYLANRDSGTNAPDSKPPFNSVPSGVVYIPADATLTWNENDDLDGFILSKYQPVTGYAAIPANTTIEYLGCLGEKTRMQVVSYVGTGTYGEANPCSLTFDFPPKVVVFLEMSGPSYRASCVDDNYGNDLRIIILKELDETFKQYFGFGRYVSSFAKKSADERTVSWYNTYNQGSQGNSTGYTYYFLAIG